VTRTVGGYLTRPGPGWRRLRWQELERRSGGHLVWLEPRVPPSGSWFNNAELPESLIAPPEGSLDEASFIALLGVLEDHSADGADTSCFAYYAPMTSRSFGEDRLFEGPLGSVRNLVEGDDALGCTPSNIWAQDRSWFVWTDWDLWGTKISGT